MKIASKYVVILIWVLFMAILITGLELFARYKLGYHLNSIKLEKSLYFERDKLKIYNRNFVEDRKSYFKNWPIPLDTFDDDDLVPRYLFKPNLKMASINGKWVPAQEGDKVVWSSNSWGFRGKEFSVEKPRDTIRIIALGASTTEGSTADDETYPHFLEQILKSKGYNVEVINAGHHGQNIDDLLAIYKEGVLTINPDIVIFYEVSNNTNPHQWIRADLNWGFHKWPAGYGKLFSFIHEHSAVFVFITQRLDFEKKIPPKIDYSFNPDLPKDSIVRFEQNIREMADIAKEENIKLILTTFITIIHEDLEVDESSNRGIWEDIYLKYYPFTPGEIVVIYEGFNQTIKEISQLQGLPLIDLAAQFPKDPQYFRDHIHFTPGGNMILANIIADFLQKEGVFEKSLPE